MSAPTQAEGLGRLVTPLGEDALLLRRFEGEEAISGDFEFRLEVEASGDDADLSELLGEEVSVHLQLIEPGTERAFRGVVSAVTASDVESARRLTLVPWFALLAHASDSRVYREATVADVVDEVFARHGTLAHHEWRLRDGYPELDFTVQYRESDAAFVERMLARHGIYRHHEHEGGRLLLVLSDHASMQTPGPHGARVAFDPDASNPHRDQETVTRWRREARYGSSRCTVRAHDWRQSHTRLEASESWTDAASGFDSAMERYEWSGPFASLGDADRHARLRAEALAWPAATVTGETGARGLAPGHTFALENHPSSAENGEYLVLRARYGFDVAGWRSGADGSGGFRCAFEALETSVQYRPVPDGVPAPRIDGVQCATVAGPPGEEIWTDEHGCVKLKFRWDRSEHENERASGWVRVSQVHAGKGFGALHVPRVGEQVLVQFMDGDPDRPIVVGRVYDDFNASAVELPGKAMVGGLRTRSTPGGGGYNELLFDDSKGAESVSLRAERDMSLLVQNDRGTEIGNERKTSVGTSDSLDVGTEAETTVGTSYALEAGTEVTIKAGTSITLEAGGSTIELGPAGITIRTGALVTVQGSMIKLN